MSHLRNHHGAKGREANIIIRKFEIVAKQSKGAMEKNVPVLENQIWFEVDVLPSFNIKPIELLRIPNHVFVSKRLFEKIQKLEA